MIYEKYMGTFYMSEQLISLFIILIPISILLLIYFYGTVESHNDYNDDNYPGQLYKEKDNE